MTMARFWGEAWILVALVAGSGCGSDAVAGGGGAGGGGDGGAGDGSFGDSLCYACLGGACGEAFAACEQDPGCAGWLSCLEACPVGEDGDADAACEAACPADGTATVAARDGVVACRGEVRGLSCTACGPAAGSGGAGGGDVTPICELPAIAEQQCAEVENENDCYRCNYDACCDSADLVFGGAAGELGDCWLECETTECDAACFEAYPDQVDEFAGYQACLTVNCLATDRCGTSGACALCQNHECTCELAACQADLECFLLLDCAGRCDTPGCAQGCIDARPEGAAAFDALLVCTSQRCVDQCG
jgi:hypothetical protein